MIFLLCSFQKEFISFFKRVLGPQCTSVTTWTTTRNSSLKICHFFLPLSCRRISNADCCFAALGPKDKSSGDVQLLKYIFAEVNFKRSPTPVSPLWRCLSWILINDGTEGVLMMWTLLRHQRRRIKGWEPGKLSLWFSFQKLRKKHLQRSQPERLASSSALICTKVCVYLKFPPQHLFFITFNWNGWAQIGNNSHT